jgi:hypothetical protein
MTEKYEVLAYKGKVTADGKRRIEDGTIKIEYNGEPLLLVAHLEYLLDSYLELNETV